MNRPTKPHSPTAIATSVDKYIRTQIATHAPIDARHIGALSGWDHAAVRRAITEAMQRLAPVRGPRP